MKHLAIRNWKEYQHYKDRRPPWVKLHVHVLTDERLNALSPTSRLVAFLMLAIAANRDNQIPDDPAWLAVECSITKPMARKAVADLLAARFIVRASAPASSGASKPASGGSSNRGEPALAEVLEPPARPPAHGETERETESESSNDRPVLDDAARNGTVDLNNISVGIELAIAKVCTLKRADDKTGIVLRSMFGGKLPPAAFYAAHESAMEKGGDVGYAIGALKKMVEEGTYA